MKRRPSGESGSESMEQLDELVAVEQQQQRQAGGAAEVDDRTLQNILGALQDQFKPDEPSTASTPAPSLPCLSSLEALYHRIPSICICKRS